METNPQDYWPQDKKAYGQEYIFKKIKFTRIIKGEENDRGSLDKKGLNVRDGIGEDSEVIDILTKGTNVYFEFDDDFNKRPWDYHKLDPQKHKYESSSYIKVAKEHELKRRNVYVKKNKDAQDLPLQVSYKFREDVRDGKISIFDEPIKANIATVLGYPGNYLKQKNIIHLEIFTDNINFMDKKDKDGKNIEDEKIVYKIKKV